MWTHFWDMHSGGGQKEDYAHIYIEAPEAEAEVIFYNRFGHNPYRVTCTCCGPDYSLSSEKSLAQLTGYQRNCEYENGKYVEKACTRYSNAKLIKLKDYVKLPEVLVIRKKDIKPQERKGSVPKQGYVWMD